MAGAQRRVRRLTVAMVSLDRDRDAARVPTAQVDCRRDRLAAQGARGVRGAPHPGLGEVLVSVRDAAATAGRDGIEECRGALARAEISIERGDGDERAVLGQQELAAVVLALRRDG